MGRGKGEGEGGREEEGAVLRDQSAGIENILRVSLADAVPVRDTSVAGTDNDCSALETEFEESGNSMVISWGSL